MKNLPFLLLVFHLTIASNLSAQELISTDPSDSQKETPDQSKIGRLKNDQLQVVGTQQDTLSEADRLILSAQYQSLDHAPSIMVMTNEGQTYTWSAKGINFWDGTSKINITTENAHIPENNITSLALDANDHLWIGTYNHGIVKGTGYPVKPFKTKIIPTHDLQIFSIVTGNSGGMWVTYRNGGYEFFKDCVSLAYFPGTMAK